MKKLVVVAAMAALWGCSSGSVEISADSKVELWNPEEVTAETVLADQTPVEPDVSGLPEVWPDLSFDILADLPNGGCEAGSGCFGEVCKDNDQCLSGWCMEHQGEGVCSMECQEECPQGWQCKAIGGTEPDLVYACVSAFANLCKPCASSADCKSPGGIEDVCMDYGQEGAFCGGGCLVDEDCPTGFSCLEGSTTDGIDILQCMADSGQCPCTAKSAALKLWTPCTVESEAGICSGMRICQADGLSDCDAATPAPDDCNGVDDDCDGAVDENTCDDNNPCTDDLCLGQDGCQNAPITGGPCEDGDVCTMADHCEEGTCLGTPVICDDQNLCTDDYCDQSGGCKFDLNQVDCDDGDPCTVADECTLGECLGTAVNCDCQTDADCLPLEDGNMCTGMLFCDDSALPFVCKTQPGTPVVCPEPEGVDAPCLQSVCDPDSGQCSMQPDHEGMACEDGDACTLGDKCEAGVCTGGIAANCNDGNPCTDDSCSSESGCTNQPNEAPCDDGDACTADDLCAQTVCLPGSPVNCDDQNLCTNDSCDPATGCANQPNNEFCDDGNACTTGDICNGGQCQPTGMLDCNDWNLCTNDSCQPDAGCANIPNANPCSDEDACTTGDVCEAGLCIPGDLVVCNDYTPCTADACLPESGCVFAPDNLLVCSDDNQCTVGDACNDGACIPGALEDCDDEDVCTTDWCHPAQGCVHDLNAAPCNDDNVCTTGDLCQLGDCIGGLPLPCDDQNPCTDDSCAPLAGCQFVPNQEPCDDLDQCTTVDQCVAGQCKGSQPPDCSDEDPCTDTWCDAVDGCMTSLNQAPCDDGNKCTTVDQCNGGECEGSVPPDCDDGNICTDDSCDPDLGCQWDNNTAPCSDEDVCTTVDSCVDGVCTGSQLQECDDQNVCTEDLCDADTGCYAQPQDGQCDDGELCTMNDLCSAGECVGTPCADEGMICGPQGCQACASVSFDGNDDFLETGATWGDVTDGTGDVTFETWFKLTDTAPLHAGLVSVSCGLYGIQFAENNRLMLVRWPGPNCTGPTSVSVGQWHHVAAVADVGANGAFTLYLDGEEECSGVAGQPISNWVNAHQEKVFVGTTTGGGCISEGNNATPTHFLPAMMSNVRVSSDAAYTEGFVPDKQLQPLDETALLYVLSEGQGETLNDSSVNGLDGTLSGASWVQESHQDGCCLPLCDDKQCGNDGCGGSCGDCQDGENCISGLCTNQCFFDDFNDSDVSDWSILEGSWGFTTGKDGTVAWGYKGGNYASGRATHTSLKGLQWFSIEMDFRVDWGWAGDYNLYMYEVGTDNSYDLGMFPAGSDSSPDRIHKVFEGAGSQVANHGYTIGGGQWNTLKFVRNPGGNLEVYKNGDLYMSGTDTDITGALDLVIRFHGNGFVDNVKVICLGED